MSQDFYQTLGVSKTASESEIKSAYKSLAKKHHPDVPGGDEAKFKEINAAYETLKDPQKRAAYDQVGQGFNQAGQSGWREYRWNGGGPNAQEFHFDNSEDLEEALRTMFRASGFRHSRQNYQPENRNIHITIQIPVDSIINEQERTVQINTGRSNKTVQIKIPKAVRSGATIRYTGHGQDVVDNAPPGDLLVTFEVVNTKKFVRHGDNLVSALDIDCLDAITGTNVEFVTVYGQKLNVKIPPGVQSGHTLRIPGKGLPSSSIYDPADGDQLIVLNVYIPTNLTPSQIDQVRKVKSEKTKND